MPKPITKVGDVPEGMLVEAETDAGWRLVRVDWRRDSFGCALCVDPETHDDITLDYDVPARKPEVKDESA